MATGSPTRLRSPERAEQIRERATQLFAELGVKRVTMKEIARRCGITEAALYRHYPSKEAIYEACVKSLGQRLRTDAALAEIDRSDDPAEVLASLARLVLATLGRQPEVTRVLLHCSLDRHPLCAQAFQDLRGPFVRFLARKLRRMIRAGRIRAVQPDITARCFVGMVMDCCLSLELWEGLQDRPFRQEDLIRNNVSIYVDGLAPKHGRAATPHAPGRPGSRTVRSNSRTRDAPSRVRR